jgi:hypothetical protein
MVLPTGCYRLRCDPMTTQLNLDADANVLLLARADTPGDSGKG